MGAADCQAASSSTPSKSISEVARATSNERLDSLLVDWAKEFEKPLPQATQQMASLSQKRDEMEG